MLTHVEWLTQTFARQDVVKDHAKDLLCRRCGSDQNQIMNQASDNPQLEWRCRKCGHRFITTIK